MTININVTFDSGLGGLTIAFNDDKREVDHTNAEPVSFDGMSSGDIIEVDGSCTGTAKIVFDVPTTPATPKSYNAGPMHSDFMID